MFTVAGTPSLLVAGHRRLVTRPRIPLSRTQTS